MVNSDGIYFSNLVFTVSISADATVHFLLCIERKKTYRLNEAFLVDWHNVSVWSLLTPLGMVTIAEVAVAIYCWHLVMNQWRSRQPHQSSTGQLSLDTASHRLRSFVGAFVVDDSGAGDRRPMARNRCPYLRKKIINILFNMLWSGFNLEIQLK